MQRLTTLILSTNPAKTDDALRHEPSKSLNIQSSDLNVYEHPDFNTNKDKDKMSEM
ncbi:hypothetical protein Bca101_075978 [Brassica carinata]